MTSQELAAAVFAANDVALQWYSVTHDRPIPGSAGTISVQQSPTGGFSASFGAGTMLLVGGLILAAVLLFKK